MEMTNIYVLRLAEGKFYIGKSGLPENRILDHFSLCGSVWTRKYNPVEVVEIMKGDNFDEDKITKKYMSTHGIDNVRGGS